MNFLVHFLNWIINLFKVDTTKLLPAHQTSLIGLTASVFVRQPNGSRTDLELHIKQLLAERGAMVLPTDQKVGMELLKEGRFDNSLGRNDVNIVGTFFLQETEVMEPEHVFKIREEEHALELKRWEDRKRLYTVYAQDPRPVLQERKEEFCYEYRLSFEAYGSDGTILFAGTSRREDFRDEMPLPSENDEMLIALAKEMMSHLDRANLWSRITFGV